MRTIHRFKVPLEMSPEGVPYFPEAHLEIPVGFKVVGFNSSNTGLSIYADVDPEETKIPVKVRFVLTGEEIPETGIYVGMGPLPYFKNETPEIKMQHCILDLTAGVS